MSPLVVNRIVNSLKVVVGSVTHDAQVTHRRHTTTSHRLLPSKPPPRHDQDHDKQVGRHSEAGDEKNNSGRGERLVLAFDVGLVRPVPVRLAAENSGARNASGNGVTSSGHDCEIVLVLPARLVKATVAMASDITAAIGIFLGWKKFLFKVF